MDRLERLHTIAVNSYRTGTGHRWVACLAARRIVGRYIPGATLSLATDLRVSPEQVKAMARAGDTYCMMRKYCKELPEYRKALSYTHFETMGALMIKHDIPMHEAIEQIKTAAEEGSSVAQLRKYIAGEYVEGTGWLEKLHKMVKMGRELLESDAPGDVDMAIADFIMNTQDYL